MNKMSIRKDDLVVVLSGKEKGKRGKVLEVMPKSGKVVVEKINVVARHTKPRKQGEQGGILKKEAPSMPARCSASAQVQQAHPPRPQAAGGRQEGPRLQEVRPRSERRSEQ